ncbi:hypothetical protein C8N37_103234 [Sphingobacterium faecium]|jgi:hypothetical protein|nr:hypothetical protein C8N37_103234 [Sphingobacterium faecium]
MIMETQTRNKKITKKNQISEKLEYNHIRKA